MIRVRRGSEPGEFAEHSKQLSAEFNDAKRADPHLTISRFWTSKRQKLKNYAGQLLRDQHSKCAFCESHIEHVSRPQIEHYRPKSIFPELTFVWDNWLISCGRCNESKWSHFPICDGEPCLVNPASDNPEDHLEFFGYVALAKTQRGDMTKNLLGLNRSPLEDERSQWLMYLDALLLLLLNAETRAQARQLLVWCMQDEAPYAAMTRCYLVKRTPLLASPAEPHPHVNIADPRKRITDLINSNTESLNLIG